MRQSLLIVCVMFLVEMPQLRAACETLIQGPIALDVAQCQAIQPEQRFASKESRFNFIHNLPPGNRAKYFDTYRGLQLRGKVVRSLAVRSGLSPERGALSGETIAVFVRPNVSGCEALAGKRIQAQLEQVCCEGAGVAPCLLGSGFVFNKIKVVGDASMHQGHAIRSRGPAKQGYQQAALAMSKRDFKNASNILEKIQQEKMLDTQGEFLLGASYREQDLCSKAISPLESIFSKFEKNSFWADDEVYIRKGVLLLARCFSMLGQPGDSVMVLQSFLVEPKKFKKEIMQSLSHPDFGGIQTDKQFITYRDLARKAVSVSE